MNMSVSCARDIPPAYYLPSATDGCTPSNLINVNLVSEVITNQTCVNRYTLTRAYRATDEFGNTGTCSQIITVNDREPPHFNQPPPISPMYFSCASDVPPVSPGGYTAYDECIGVDDPDEITVRFKEVKTDSTCRSRYTLTRTWTANDACGNQAVYKQIIYVNDQQAPEFNGSLPFNETVSTASEIPPAPPQTAKDNCEGTPTITLTEAKSNVQCANRFTLTRTWVAKDACGNTSSRTQVITVNDTQPPTISNVSADVVTLWPPNHKMRDVAVNYTATDNSELTRTLTVNSSDPITGTSDGDLGPDWEVVDANHLKLRAEKANNGQARYYTISANVSDGCNAPVVAAVTVVVAHNITGPQTGNSYKIGSTVSLNGSFWDKPGNVHSAKWLLDGSAAANGSVIEPSDNQNGKVSGSYKFNTAGVYKLQMNVIDQTGVTSYVNTNNDLDAIVVIYDPNGGNAYGGGWYQSQPGCLKSDPAATGKASYGFAVNYANAAKPKGETQFEFKVGSFEFNALNFDYLSINNAKAQFKGTGKIIGGQSGIGFIMTVIDGAIDGTGVDKIRMKIYNRNTGYVYYDNQPGASDADDPATIVGTNSTIVIQGAQQLNTTSREVMNREEPKEMIHNELQLVAFPNPSNRNFSVQVKTHDYKTKLHVQVFDRDGKLIERRENLQPGSLIRLGDGYKAAIYFVRFTQGNQHAETELLKLSK